MILKNEIRPILELFAALILSFIVIPLGILHNTAKSIYHSYKLNPFDSILYFLIYWMKFIYQIWNAVKYLSHHLAITIDLFGNATSGEAIEDLITSKEETYFGRGDITISAATGEIEIKGKLNKTGQWFTRALNKIFNEKSHSIDAYKREIENKQIAKNIKIKNINTKIIYRCQVLEDQGVQNRLEEN